MLGWLASQTFLAGSDLPAHCAPQTDFLLWLSRTFHNCVPTPLAAISTLLGSLSFGAWLFAQLPQIYKNYQVQSTAGLSFLFLLVWLLGDTTNLAGAILTRQASWQVLVASYYTFVDCILVFQYGYYTLYLHRDSPKVQSEDSQPNSEGSNHDRRHDREVRRSNPLDIGGRQPDHRIEGNGKNPFGSFRFGSPAGREKNSNPRRTHLTAGSGSLPAASPKTVLLLVTLLAVLAHASPLSASITLNDDSSHARRELIGKTVSWISTVSYLASRFPQIIKNARRRSTAGLSITLFIAAFFGNLFYATSLLTNPCAWSSYPPHGHFGWADADGSDRRTWVLLALPFWLGAAGVLSLDLTVFIQFLVYGGGTKPITVIQVPDERGRPHWRRMSGWMRGWVPSPGPGGLRSRFSSQDSLFRRPLSSPRDEARPLLSDEAWPGESSRPTPSAPFRGAGEDSNAFRPGSPQRPGTPSIAAASRLRPPGSPLGTSPLARETYGTNDR